MSLFANCGPKTRIYARPRPIEVQRALVARGCGYGLADVRPINRQSRDGSALVHRPLAGDHPGLRLGIAALNQVRKTIIVDGFGRFCHGQISADNIPGMRCL